MTALGSIPATNRRVPHTPDFLWSFLGSLNFLRLSLKKGAHAVLSRAAYRKFGVSRSFFARCGIPRVSPASLLRLSLGAPPSPLSSRPKRTRNSYFAPAGDDQEDHQSHGSPREIRGSAVERSLCGCSFVEMFVNRSGGGIFSFSHCDQIQNVRPHLLPGKQQLQILMVHQRNHHLGRLQRVPLFLGDRKIKNTQSLNRLSGR
jgi:hypothetical protein